MITHFCDRCGCPIEKGELRYTARIQVTAAYDPLEIELEDLLKDHRQAMDELMAQCAQMTEDELMRDVHVEFEFDLCRACQRAYIAQPLPPPAPPESGES